MKKKYFLAIGASVMLLTSCATKHHYGCSGRGGRCITDNSNDVKTADTPDFKKNA
ncbi:hypothetical protein [Flavobacterium rhizosphaerae]|uniref:Lipoprotein n=1 Tax=Flavobacterium rhizosphaerae TaxID=3163298 RepID=A0ABW8YXM2_9FLAO